MGVWRRQGLGLLKLTVVKRRVEAAPGQQRGVIPLLDDFAVPHNQNDIGVLNRGKAMGDDKGSTALHQGLEGLLELHLRAGVDAGGGLVQDQHRRQAEHDPGNAQKLPLPLADGVAGEDGI